MPELVNAHAHSAMTPLRGAGGGGLAADVLAQRVIWPAEARMRPADAYAGMLLGCIEMLQHGITTSAEMYMHADSVAQAALAAGSRMLLAPAYFDVPGAPWRSAMREIDDWIDADGLRFGPGDRIELGLATRGGTCRLDAGRTSRRPRIRRLRLDLRSETAWLSALRVCGLSPKTVQCSEPSHEVGRHLFCRKRYPARTASVTWPLPADRLAKACADDSVRGRRRSRLGERGEDLATTRAANRELVSQLSSTSGYAGEAKSGSHRVVGEVWPRLKILSRW